MARSRYAKNLLMRVADRIEAEAELYDQSVWGGTTEDGHDSNVLDELQCGTPACVAGWTIRCASKAKVRATEESTIDLAAAKLLELSWDEKCDLFSGGEDEKRCK